MNLKYIELQKDGGVAIAWLNKPKANTYDTDLMRDINAVIDEVRFDDEVVVCLWASKLDGMWSAGADINLLATSTPDYKAMFCLNCQEVLNKLESTPKPFIAAIDGHCVGGGLEIALATDLRFASDGPWKIGLPEVTLGVLPGTGGTQRLPRLVGQGRGARPPPREARGPARCPPPPADPRAPLARAHRVRRVPRRPGLPAGPGLRGALGEASPRTPGDAGQGGLRGRIGRGHG